MYRTLPYLGLFAAAALLQVFLFDNLTISIYLNPLVYIVFIALLPLDTPPAAVLGAGLALGTAPLMAGKCWCSSFMALKVWVAQAAPLRMASQAVS